MELFRDAAPKRVLAAKAPAKASPSVRLLLSSVRVPTVSSNHVSDSSESSPHAGTYMRLHRKVQD